MKIIRQSTNVLVIREEEMDKRKRLCTFNTSDVHYDSIYFNEKLFRKHLDEAQERNALVFIYGDFFDAMQGRDDPRRARTELLEKYNTDDYYMALVMDAIDFLSQWNLTYFIARGNHETGVKRKVLVDMIAWMEALGKAKGMKIASLPYAGFIRFQFSCYGNQGVRKSYLSYYHHGNGGSAPVTKGVIQAQRQAVELPDVDIVWNGHNHNAYSLPLPRHRFNFMSNEIYDDLQWHNRTPGYKRNALVSGALDGFDLERGSAKPNGGMFCDFTLNAGNYEIELQNRIAGVTN